MAEQDPKLGAERFMSDIEEPEASDSVGEPYAPYTATEKRQTKTRESIDPDLPERLRAMQDDLMDRVKQEKERSAGNEDNK